MKEIKGTAFGPDFMADFEEVADIHYYDGPLVVHYRRADGTNWIFWWCDCSDTHNRWLLMQFDLADIEAYCADNITGHALWGQPKRVLFADVDEHGVSEEFIEISADAIPGEYRPTDNVAAPSPIQ